MADDKEIQNPRRILAVSLEDGAQHLSRVVKDLTGAAPEPVSTSLAGTTHDLPLTTPYYSATVPVWLDLIASPSEWASSFLSEEAREVLAVLGGLVVIFSVQGDLERTRQLVHQVGRVVKEGLGGWEWDGVGLAVGVGEGQTEEWDELCAEAGLEFVQVTGKDKGRNEFGEKMGIPRVKEALEANDWAQLDADALSDFGDFKDPSDNASDDEKALDPESLDFGFDRADFEGLRKAIWSAGQEDDGDAAAEEKRMAEGIQGIAKSKDGPGKDPPTSGDRPEDAGLGDEDVAKVEKMMRKLQAVREAGEGMGQEQRRRMAARAVEEVMKEL